MRWLRVRKFTFSENRWFSFLALASSLTSFNALFWNSAIYTNTLSACGRQDCEQAERGTWCIWGFQHWSQNLKESFFIVLSLDLDSTALTHLFSKHFNSLKRCFVNFYIRNDRFQLLFTWLLLMHCTANTHKVEVSWKVSWLGHERFKFCQHFNISVCFWNQNCRTDMDQYGSQQFFAALAGIKTHF